MQKYVSACRAESSHLSHYNLVETELFPSSRCNVKRAGKHVLLIKALFINCFMSNRLLSEKSSICTPWANELPSNCLLATKIFT